MKDDSSPSTPVPHYPDIFHGYVIPIESSKELVFDYVIVDHTQISWDVIFTSKLER